MILKNISIKIIQIIHLLIILYILVGPFFKNHLDNTIVLITFILYRWITDDNNCTVTKIESYLTGNDEGFIFRIVNPIYKLNENKLNKLLYFFMISWLIIIIFIKYSNYT